MTYSKITPYTQLFKPSETLHRWNSISKWARRCCFFIFNFIVWICCCFYQRLKLKNIFLFWKGRIYIYCRISCTINAFIIIIVNLSMTLFNILFWWRQRLFYIHCIPQIVKWNLCNKVFGSPFTCKTVHVSLSIGFLQPVD